MIISFSVPKGALIYKEESEKLVSLILFSFFYCFVGHQMVILISFSSTILWKDIGVIGFLLEFTWLQMTIYLWLDALFYNDNLYPKHQFRTNNIVSVINY